MLAPQGRRFPLKGDSFGFHLRQRYTLVAQLCGRLFRCVDVGVWLVLVFVIIMRDEDEAVRQTQDRGKRRGCLESPAMCSKEVQAMGWTLFSKA